MKIKRSLKFGSFSWNDDTKMFTIEYKGNSIELNKVYAFSFLRFAFSMAQRNWFRKLEKPKKKEVVVCEGNQPLNPVTKEEKELRSKALHILSNEKRHQFYNQFENTVRPVLIEKSNNIITQGFTDNYIKVHIEENISIQNTIVSVLLKKNNGSHMEGEII